MIPSALRSSESRATPESERCGDGVSPDLLAGDFHLTGTGAESPADSLHRFAAPGSEQTGQADHLAGSHLQIDVMQAPR